MNLVVSHNTLFGSCVQLTKGPGILIRRKTRGCGNSPIIPSPDQQGSSARLVVSGPGARWRLGVEKCQEKTPDISWLSQKTFMMRWPQACKSQETSIPCKTSNGPHGHVEIWRTTMVKWQAWILHTTHLSVSKSFYTSCNFISSVH